VTDSFSGQGRVGIVSDKHTIAEIEASEPLASLVAAGRHETGRCGFVFDETIVPGLEGLTDVEIYDVESGLLIYRRAPAGQFIPEKLIRLDTHLVPLRRVDTAIRRRFSYSYVNAERAGLESVTQIFHLLLAKSIYLSGRFLYRSFENLIDKQFKMICLLHDPFEELAERLLFFRHVARRGRMDLRDSFTFAGAIEFAAGLMLSDDRRLRAALGRITSDALLALQNPLVRQLTVPNLQDLPRGGAVASALGILASCAVVGLRDESAQFASAMSALLSSDTDVVPAAPRCTAAIDLAVRLREIPMVHTLLELDLELYDRVAEAYRQAAAGLSIPSGKRYFSVP